MKRNLKGFTLIEVLVAMAIVAILAAVAVPSYSEYVNKARRLEVVQAFLDIETSMEKYLLQTNQTTTNLVTVLDTVGIQNMKKHNSSWVRTLEDTYYFRVNSSPDRLYLIGTAYLDRAAADRDCNQWFYYLDNGEKMVRSVANEVTTEQCWPD